MFERLSVLDQVSVDGLRRWALLGVQGHTQDLSRNLLVPSGEPGCAPILRAAVRVRCSAMWSGASFYFARVVGAPAGASRRERGTRGNKGRRVSIVDGRPHAGRPSRSFRGKLALRSIRPLRPPPHTLVYSTQRFPVVRCVHPGGARLLDRGRARRAPSHAGDAGLRRLWLPFHVASPASP